MTTFGAGDWRCAAEKGTANGMVLDSMAQVAFYELVQQSHNNHREKRRRKANEGPNESGWVGRREMVVVMSGLARAQRLRDHS